MRIRKYHNVNLFYYAVSLKRNELIYEMINRQNNLDMKQGDPTSAAILYIISDTL